MLAVLGGLADVERDLIHTPAEGRSRAKPQGRRPTSFPDTGTAERGYQTTRTGRDVAGIGRELRTQHFKMNRYHIPEIRDCIYIAFA